MAALRNKNVRRLDVAVQDPFGMSSIERVGNLDCQTKQNIGFDRPARDAMLERDAIEKLHDQEGMPILLSDLMNSADIRMIERRSGLRLALKTRQSLRVFDNVVGQKFQGDETMKGNVLSLVNHAHAAAAEFFDDAVMRDRLADH